MSPVLLDVNVLVALNWQHHPQHSVATTWFDRLKVSWASCPMTECGFIRLSINPKVIPGACTAARAAELIASMHGQRRGVFWPDDLRPSKDPIMGSLKGHQQVTDAYLLALAHRHKGQLATFDHALVTLAHSSGIGQIAVDLSV